MPRRRIAVVGGGPSGSICAATLAAGGAEVTLFDEHLAWEKPCGGGLTHKALVAYPFLLSHPAPKKQIERVELIAPNGQRVSFTLDHPVVIYSRKVLNGLLLDRARQAGCQIVCARVTAAKPESAGVLVEWPGANAQYDFVVIAAGARNALLPETPALAPEDLEMTFGYFLPIQSDVLRIKFPERLQGYIWSFPRADHLSVGICAAMKTQTSRGLRNALDRFLRDEGIDSASGHSYSHILPAPRKKTLQRRPIVGRNWALAGDAAALVDPVTGEGIYYALRSGEILAQCLLEGEPQQYPLRLRGEFTDDLQIAAGIAPRFYNQGFLGDRITTRMIQFAAHSPSFRNLVRDVFSGEQAYQGLSRRLWTKLGLHLSEIAASKLRGSRAETE